MSTTAVTTNTHFAPSLFIDASNAVLLLVDCQPGLSLASSSRPHRELVDNIIALARTAAVFDVPVVATTSATQRFSGPAWPSLQDVLADQPIERHVLNPFEDEHVRQAVEKTGRRVVLVAGLLTEACVSFPALSYRTIGRDVYVVGDCCSGSTPESHNLALARLGGSGIQTTSWLQLLLEWQQDWTRSATYPGATAILADLGGAYGLALQHARDMLASPAATPA